MVQGDNVVGTKVCDDEGEESKEIEAALDTCLNILIDKNSNDQDVTDVCYKLSDIATRCTQSDVDVFRRLGGISALSRVLKRPDVDGDMAEAAAAALTKLSLPLSLRPATKRFKFDQLSVTIKELEYCETGTAYNLWTAALVMCNWVVESKEMKTEFEGGKKVLELGSGLGLVGCLVSKMGGDVTFSDFVPKVLENLEDTVTTNKLKGRVVSLNWEKEAEPKSKGSSSSSWYGGDVDEGEISRFQRLDDDETFDMIVGTDICYEADHPELLHAVVSRRLRRGEEQGGNSCLGDESCRGETVYPQRREILRDSPTARRTCWHGLQVHAGYTSLPLLPHIVS
eukprot:752665-Hanusia_phi.AAC.4